jgi:hypothetical protein
MILWNENPALQERNKIRLFKQVQLKPKNFTLLEVVLALAIFMLVTSIAVMALTSTERTLRKVTAADKRLEERQLIDRLINRAFKNAVNFTWQDSNLQQQMVFSGKRNELLVCYLHRIDPAKNSAIRFLKLFMEEDNLVAEYSTTPILSWLNSPETATREIIATGISNLSFSYADIDQASKQINIVGSWDNETTPYIPPGIQLELEWNDGSTDVWFRRTAGAGYGQQLGRRRYKQ